MAAEADVVFGNPLHGIDRFQSNQRVGRVGLEHATQSGGQLGVRTDGHEIGPTDAERNDTGWELLRTNKGVELTGRPSFFITKVVPFGRPGLVVV